MESAVLDANIFFHIRIIDPLLTLAEDGLFEPIWSDQIMQEVRVHLPEVWGKKTQKVDDYLHAINDAFPWASVSGWQRYVEHLCLPDPDDRHVLAAACVAGASVIVTLNLKDFPLRQTEKMGVVALSPDVFLSELFDYSPQKTMKAMRNLAKNKHHPPQTFNQEIEGFKRAGLLTFSGKLAGEE